VFDSEDKILTGHLADIHAGVGFHASDADRVPMAFQDAVDDIWNDALAEAQTITDKPV